MNTKAEIIREKIVSTADDLFYRQGFNHTSFTDIATAVGISRGNFYYHFKTKDDILSAVIEKRKVGIKKMLKGWDEVIPSAKERLNQYIDMVVGYQENIIKYGCPIGSVCSELSKLKNINKNDAVQMIILFRDWIAEQFVLLGQDKDKANHLAMHLLTCSQGITVVAQAFSDSAYIKREADSLKQWLAKI